MGLIENYEKHLADVDKYVNTLFPDGLPDWIPIADVEKIRSAAERCLNVPPVNVGKAIGAAICYPEYHDYDALVSRCIELNVSAVDALYFATVFRAIESGVENGNGLPLLLGGRQSSLIVKAVRKYDAAKGGKKKRGTVGAAKKTLERIVAAIGSAKLEDVLSAIEDEDDRIEEEVYYKDGDPSPVTFSTVDRIKETIQYENRKNGQKKTITHGTLDNHLTAFR